MASLSLIVGIIGNVTSMLLFVSPMGTFWQVVKKKSTEDYEALPYVTTLMCMTMWVFYGFLKKKRGLLIVTVNGIGAVFQLIYVTLFLIYASKAIKVKALKLIAVLDIVIPSVVIVLSLLAIPSDKRLIFVGVVCAVTSVAMFASPFSFMRTVIKTKSVEYMPFYLSLSLFLVGGVWALYSFLIRDYFIGVPNAIGCLLGTAQLVLYFIYKNKSLSSAKLTTTSIVNQEQGLAKPGDGPL